MRPRWLVPIAILYSLRLLAAESAVKPRVATITINPSEVTTLHLRPEFESTIHMPEEITSVILGSLTLPSECVVLSRPGFEDHNHPRRCRGGGNVGIVATISKV